MEKLNWTLVEIIFYFPFGPTATKLSDVPQQCCDVVKRLFDFRYIKNKITVMSLY